MTDNVVRREVQRRDDPFGIPACFYWTMDEVADWVDSIGYGKYKENFRSHFINGRKLLTVDACVLPRMGITHFGDILELSAQIQKLMGKGPSGRWMPEHCQQPDSQPVIKPRPCKVPQILPSDGRDIDYNWRLWVPEFYYGYTPKGEPVSAADFEERWNIHQHGTWTYLGRHMYNLLRPP